MHPINIRVFPSKLSVCREDSRYKMRSQDKENVPQSLSTKENIPQNLAAREDVLQSTCGKENIPGSHGIKENVPKRLVAAEDVPKVVRKTKLFGLKTTYFQSISIGSI